MSRRRNRTATRQYTEKADPNIQVVVAQQGVATPATMPRHTRAYIQEGYRGNKTVFRVVGHIARAGAGIKWKHYTDESKKREVPNSDLLKLWNTPAPRVSGTAFREAMIAYYCLTGNSYILGIQAKLQQNPTAPFDELYNLRPDLTKIKVDDNGPLYYEFGNFSPPRRYENPFVMHNKLFAGNDDVYGMSPVEVAAMLVDIQKAGQKWNLGLLSNMARPGGAWVTDALLGDTEYKGLKEEIRRKFAGPRNAGETAILHGGVKWQSMSMSPYELDWLESDTKGDRDIAGIFFNFPLFLLGLADSTYSNQEEARYALYTEIEFPLLDMFQDSLNMWLTPRYGGFLGYDQEDVEAIQRRLQEAKAQASDRAAAEFTGGTTTFLEAREIQDRPKINVKDFVMLNQVPVHVDDLDDYIAAMSGKVINPPEPPPMLPPPKTTVTEVDNSGDNVDNQPGGDNTPPQKSMDELKLAQWQVERRQQIDTQLADYAQRQVSHLRWVCDGHPCPECIMNDHEVVEAGDAFPSGDELPPLHPNCMCEVVEMSTAQYGMGGANPEMDVKDDETSAGLAKYISTLPQLAVTREQYRELLRAKR
jgi:HK97 family phage portal protein